MQKALLTTISPHRVEEMSADRKPRRWIVLRASVQQVNLSASGWGQYSTACGYTITDELAAGCTITPSLCAIRLFSHIEQCGLSLNISDIKQPLTRLSPALRHNCVAINSRELEYGIATVHGAPSGL